LLSIRSWFGSLGLLVLKRQALIGALMKMAESKIT
jgi:hypothetical protein